MTEQKMISVILPTYNESENIRVIVPRIAEVLRDSGLEWEIIIVDDDSPDGTAEVAAQFTGTFPIKIHVRKNKRGLATAVVKGFSLSSGDICIVMDADLSHPVEKIPDMVKPILEGACDATVGSRYIDQGGWKNQPLIRKLISKFSGLLARGLSKLSDPTSGFMALKKEVFNRGGFDPIGWKIVLEIIVKTGAIYRELPIIFSERLKGQSKLDTRIQAQYIAHLWKLYCFKYPKFFQFIRFCTVGFLGLLIDTGILIGLVEKAHLDPRFAAVFSFSIAVSFNYYLNRLWTFEIIKTPKVMASYIRFVLVCITGLFLKVGVMHILIEFFNMGSSYRYVPASIIGVFLATIFNFLGTKFFAFKISE